MSEIDWKKMYLSLFNQITDAIHLLQNAQIEAEEHYIATEPRPKVENNGC